jgi:predicted ATPase
MGDDRITEIRIAGLRTLADVRLKLSGLTVLIGENGSGKSSVVEAFELLRKAAASDYVKALNRAHGGLPNLLRFGAQRLSLSLRIEGGGDGPIDYGFSLASEAGGARVNIEREYLDLSNVAGKQGPLHVIQRSRGRIQFFDRTQRQLVDAPADFDPGNLLLSAFGSLPPQPAMTRVVRALAGIDVQVPPEVRSLWVRKEQGASAPMREPVLIEPGDRLVRLGGNLANCFQTLKNNYPTAHWRETMDLVRLGLGEDVESINTQSVPGGSLIALTMELRGITQQVPASAMSDGTLAYLAWVALSRLGERSALVVDEPESHLHPALLVRVLGLFETVAHERPVVLATHSDRLLDALTDPQGTVVLCRLNAQRSTELLRPNAAALTKWLQKYRGIGEMRSEGAEAVVMTEPA